MSKSFKFKNNMYLDTKGIVHNKKLLSDILYPIGSIYMSTNNTNPANFFGGTWEQLKNRFLVGAGDIYEVNKTGGEASHTLTNNEMPIHGHTMTYNNKHLISNKATGGWYEGYVMDMNYISGCKDQPYWNTANSGGGQAHNNMPPYLAVYMWKRTA